MQGNKLLVLLAALALSFGCAVPVPPTGGPADQKPPELVRTEPDNGTTRFSGRELVFEFDEAVDLRAFTTAFSISPDLEGVPSITGSGKRMKVRLPQDPRPETTYIVSLEASLRDVHGVTLERPLTIAFSTGDIIDNAKLGGRVILSKKGGPATDVAVFAYADDDSTSLFGMPLYRTQTGTRGEFLFEHVAASEYFVLAVEDRNRNRKLDPGESFGVPPVHYVKADTVLSTIDRPWILSVQDVIPPVLERVRATSSQDLELRYSESLDLDLNSISGFSNQDTDALALLDSLGNPFSGVALYFDQSRSRTLFARVDSMPAGSYILKGTTAVKDSSNNISEMFSIDVSVAPGLPISQRPEFMMWTPDSAVVNGIVPRTIWPHENFGFRTTRPTEKLPAATLRDTTGVVFEASFLQVEPAFFVLERKGGFSFNRPFYLDINQKDFGGPDSVITGFFQYASDRRLGALSFNVQTLQGTDKDVLNVEVYSQSSGVYPIFKTSRQATETNAVVLDRIPGATKLRLRVSQGARENTWWSGGLFPWSPPDPITWLEVTEPVRARWETALPDTLDFRNWYDGEAKTDSTGSE